ncbi:hypothetical protein BH23ACT12_BH23ACT12_02550 [soil metagenome]
MDTQGKAPDRTAILATAMVVVFILAYAAAALGAPVRSSYGARITADEPEYLLTAISLAEDRSLDISDELARERYRPFHEVRIKPQAKVLEGGRMVSPHDPLLPALLVPGAVAGGWLGAKMNLALYGALLAALLLWTGVRRFGVPAGRAAVVVGLFSVSAPFAAYGSQIYPEVPAALAVAAAIACVTGPLGRRGLGGFIVSIVGLVWLGTKFIPVAAILSLLAFWRLYRTGRRLEIAVGAGVLAVAGVFYLVGHLRWYGSLTVYATGAHFAETGEFSVMGVTPDFATRTSRLIGLLVDRRFGLAAWQPAWLVMIPALAWVIRRRPAGWEVLVLPLAAGWLGATYLALTMHGWWWPGRQVVVVLPAAVLAILAWAGSARRFGVTVALGAAGVFNLGWLFVQGWRRELTMIVDFYETTNPLYRGWSRLLPDYVALTTGDWVLHAAWVAAAFVVAIGPGQWPGIQRLWRKVRRPRPPLR